MALVPCRECGKQISDQAPSCPQCGCPVSEYRSAPAALTPPLPTTSQLPPSRSGGFSSGGKLMWILGAVILAVAVIRLAVPSERTAEPPPARVQAGNAPQIPWFETAQAHCLAYRAARNEIQKSNVFNENQSFIRGRRIDEANAVLETMRTSQGGGSVDLQFAVGSAHFKHYDIARGHPLYEQVSAMGPGDCAVISGFVERSASILEESKVCDFEYVVQFESVRGCNMPAPSPTPSTQQTESESSASTPRLTAPLAPTEWAPLREHWSRLAFHALHGAFDLRAESEVYWVTPTGARVRLWVGPLGNIASTVLTKELTLYGEWSDSGGRRSLVSYSRDFSGDSELQDLVIYAGVREDDLLLVSMESLPQRDNRIPGHTKRVIFGWDVSANQPRVLATWEGPIRDVPELFRIHRGAAAEAQAAAGGGAAGGNTFGTVQLGSGFMPDPHTVTGTSGGSVDTSTWQAGCVGFVSTLPHHLFVAATTFPNLRVMAHSTADVTLVIQRPDGRYLCNDDSDGTDPLVEGAFPAGTYKVWIGSYQAGVNSPYTLGLSELSSAMPSGLGASSDRSRNTR